MIMRLPFGTGFFSLHRSAATHPERVPTSESAAAQIPDRPGGAPSLADQCPFAPDAADELPPGAGITLAQVDQHLHFADGLPVVYVQNNKAACTSVKFSLLKSILPQEDFSDSTLHERGDGPFARRLSACAPEMAADVLSRPVFTVVRNPYSRILSAYLDKTRFSQPHGREFYRRYFLQPNADEPIGFLDFLRCIASDHPRSCNPHFAPQYVNTLAHHIDYGFLGSVEDIGATAGYLRGHGIAFNPWLLHATRAATLLEAYFTEEAEALVDKIFAEDFRLFNYPRHLARAQEPPSCGERAPQRGVSLAAFIAAPQDCAQPGTREVERMRRFYRSRDPAERRAIAEEGLGFSDWRVVKALTKAMIKADLLEVAYPLHDRLTLLLTAHMDQVPERLLSEQGRTLKRTRKAILAR